MLALTAEKTHGFSDQRGPTTEHEPIARLLGRVQRLLDAACVLGLQSDPTTAAVNIVAAVGELHAADNLKAAALAFLRHHGAEIASNPPGADGVGVARLALADGCDDVIAITITVAAGSLLIFAARDRDVPPFTINEERAVRRMASWIGDYARLWHEQRCNSRRSNTLQAALDFIGTAVFVLDDRAHVIDTNQAGRQLLDAGDGLRLAGGMLTAASLDDTVRLQVAIAHAASGTTRGDPVDRATVVSVRRKDQRPLTVAVVRGATDAMPTDKAFVVLQAVDPQVDVTGSLNSACAIYGLTSAETRLVKLIVGGASLAEAAARLRIQEPTARTYLKQIFTKTGVNRQAALVHLLLTTIIRAGPTVELITVQHS